MVIEGQAGIGKSTLWHARIDASRTCAMRALVFRPAEAEFGLDHVGLDDPFYDVLDVTLAT